MDFKSISLNLAEIFDAWRVIPRAILVLYSTLVFNLYIWYKSIPTYVQEQCDAGVLQVLMNESGMTIENAKAIACSVVDVVGGPTAAQSTFVTTIIGLSTGIFGLYVATGRKWDRGYDNPNPFPNPADPRNPYYTNNPSNYPPDNGRYGPPTYNYRRNNDYGPQYGGEDYGPQYGGDDYGDTYRNQSPSSTNSDKDKNDP